MRRTNKIIQTEKRMVGRRRLLFKNIKGRTSHHSRLQGFVKISFINNATPGTVEYPHPFFHPGKGFFVNHMAGFTGHRRMNTDVISTLIQLFQADPFNAHFSSPFLRNKGIVGNHLHFQALGPICHNAADIAKTNHSESFIK